VGGGGKHGTPPGEQGKKLVMQMKSRKSNLMGKGKFKAQRGKHTKGSARGGEKEVNQNTGGATKRGREKKHTDKVLSEESLFHAKNPRGWGMDQEGKERLL